VNAGRGQLRKFFALSCREKRFFAEAFVLHLWVGLVLKVVPFRRIPGVFASRQFDAPTKAEDQYRHTVPGHQEEVIDLISKAVQRAGKASPWKNRCLVSSLAGRCMLRRRKIESQLSMGVAKDAGGKVIAHAWLRAGGFEIVPADETFRTLYQF